MSCLDQRIPAVFAIAHAYDARGDVDSAFATYQGGARARLEREALEQRDADMSRMRRAWSRS